MISLAFLLIVWSLCRVFAQKRPVPKATCWCSRFSSEIHCFAEVSVDFSMISLAFLFVFWTVWCLALGSLFFCSNLQKQTETIRSLQTPSKPTTSGPCPDDRAQKTTPGSPNESFVRPNPFYLFYLKFQFHDFGPPSQPPDGVVCGHQLDKRKSFCF